MRMWISRYNAQQEDVEWKYVFHSRHHLLPNDVERWYFRSKHKNLGIPQNKIHSGHKMGHQASHSNKINNIFESIKKY